MTYKQALKTPKQGWKYANDEQTLAALCDVLGRVLCIDGKATFEWAKRHSSLEVLKVASPRLMDRAGNSELLIAVLNDLPL